MTDMLHAALSAARAGWAVFPCDPETKAPLTKHAHLEATRGEPIIREWWDQYPDAMIGGKVPDTLLVLDIDPRNGGSYEALEGLILPAHLPETMEAVSGRGDGGRHLYFHRPRTIERLTSTRLPDGIDLKVNGYCILPPSLHPATGKPYRWVRRPIARLPKEMLAILTPPPRPPRPVGPGLSDPSRLAWTVRNAAPGERNAILHWAACRAVEENAIDDVFAVLAEAAVAAGLSEKETWRTIESAQRGA